MTEIIPAILAKSKDEFDQMVGKVDVFAKKLHLDIADGIFVPNITIDGVKELRDLDPSLEWEVHLMVSRPENHVLRWLETNVSKIIFHAEATRQTQAILDQIKDDNRLACIALNPQTTVESIKDFINQVDGVQFMAVEPGFYGSKFDPSVVEKIFDFHFLYPDVKIQVDGGVTPETAPDLIHAGSSCLISGSYIINSNNPQVAYHELIKSISNV